MTVGIYLIENKHTGQRYIGQSINIERRWREHSHWKRNTSYIDKSIAKYGVDSFTFSIIEETDINELDSREQYWIEYYNTYKNRKHYNLTPGGDFNPIKIPEHYSKMKKSLTGRKLSNKTKQKMSIARSGKNNPMYGKRGNKSPNYGRKFSNESKQKMSYSASINRNKSGYYRVYKEKTNTKQGFRWCYGYSDNGKRKVITSVDIDKLEKKVKDKNLEWRRIEDIIENFK